jgi:hypothetical protein
VSGSAKGEKLVGTVALLSRRGEPVRGWQPVGCSGDSTVRSGEQSSTGAWVFKRNLSWGVDAAGQRPHWHLQQHFTARCSWATARSCPRAGTTLHGFVQKDPMGARGYLRQVRFPIDSGTAGDISVRSAHLTALRAFATRLHGGHERRTWADQVAPCAAESQFALLVRPVLCSALRGHAYSEHT